MNALGDDWWRRRRRILRAVVGAVGIGAVHGPNAVVSILRARASAAAPALAVHIVPHERA